MRFKKSAIIILFSLGIIAVGIVARHVVFANAIVVNSNLDTTNPGDGDCTLREAISNANDDTDTTGGDCAAGSGTDTITFDAPMAITPSTGYTIDSPIIIDGESSIGTCSPFSPGVTITSSFSSAVFSIVSGSSGTVVRGFRLLGDGSSASTGINISNTSNVSVQCSSIGLDASGTGKAGFSNGIYVGVSSNITIGGLSDGDGNFISGNGIPAVPNVSDGVGIVVSGDVSNLFIEGNYIGPDVTGSAAVMNEKMGIEFPSGPVSNVSIINNVISGNGQVDSNYSPGVNIGQGAYDVVITGVILQGNKIGVASDGITAMPNENDGIFIGRQASDVLIGGSTEEERNIIGGNGCNGISMDYNATDVAIKGNYVGIGADGITDVGNGCSGISKGNQLPYPVSTNLQIGGAASGEGNYIAYNAGGGISVQYGSDVTIEGNFIGVQADGQTLALNGTNAAIGSTGTQDLVIRSGNVLAGYYQAVSLNQVTGTISGNYIGVTNDGVTALFPSDNTSNGIYAVDSSLVVGGELPEDGNIIDGLREGVKLIGLLDSSVINNQIGGQNGNSSKGLIIIHSQNPVLVKENRILNNTVAGIVVVNIPGEGPGGAYASITENSITDNGGLGIVFSSDEDEDFNPDTLDLVLNDIGDSDAGANNLLNRPVILSVDTLPPGQVKYYVDVPAGNYVTHFYTNTTNGLSDSYLGEGETFVGADTFTSTGSGAIETFTIPGGVPNASYLTATVTEDLGSGALGATSEFSNTFYGADVGTADGDETLITDDGAYHIVTDSFLGDCVNADSGDGLYDDTRGPVRAGSFGGESPCINDRDGVTFAGESVEVPGSLDDFTYIPTGPGELDDLVITGAYEGSALCYFFVAVLTISPDNGDDADYFVWIDAGSGCSDEIHGPVKITPGIPQDLGNGLFATFENGTGHTVYQDGGDGATSVWMGQLTPASFVPSGEHTGPYEPGQEIVLDVSATDPGYLNIWVDVNKNGSFQDSGEHVVVNETGSGVFSPSFNAPSSGGIYDMRVRYTTYDPGDMLPIGEAFDGEVEDYTFEVAGEGGGEPGPVAGCMNTSALNYNSSATIDNGTCRFPSGGGGSTGQAFACRDPKAINYSEQGMSNPALCLYSVPKFTYKVDVDPTTTPGISSISENFLSNIACPVFNKYARQGDRGAHVKLIQQFLNTFTGSKIVADGYYGKQTTMAVKVFQQIFSKEVLDPWEPPLSNKPTGRWYKTTRMKANQLLGCQETPVILEDNGKVWSLPEIKPQVSL